ncbi:hypothetical protein Pcinc_033219 [Petrolisthes cinctipes]|uniref:C2H2-type domain-containing protein n=1 Tax=Petrolisthes cinctipes TaxID=88211 RepID=A0AAE1ESU8_PETCI|nr:hypothetical protein Pcinc_033219 [Petrolisthes cinctipes]
MWAVLSSWESNEGISFQRRPWTAETLQSRPVNLTSRSHDAMIVQAEVTSPAHPPDSPRRAQAASHSPQVVTAECVGGGVGVAVTGVAESWDSVSRVCHHGCSVDTCRTCKPFTCHHCPYATRSRADLVKHCRQWLEQLSRVGVVAGKAKVTCPLCGKVCSRSDKLKLHLRTHTGERPYLCTYCDHRSRTSDDLKRHVRTHTGERPYQCPFCPYRASDPSTIRSHKKHRHHELFHQARLSQQHHDKANG